MLTGAYCEPPGSDSITCRLQEVWPRAPSALAAPMPQVIALMAPAALGLSGATFHEPFHADIEQRAMAVTERSNQNVPQRRQLDGMADRTSARSFALPNLAVL